MARVIVSLGSNIEPRERYLERARGALSELPGTCLLKASAVIETEPVDVPAPFAAMRFLNQAVILETDLAPLEFSRRMHVIEGDIGRIRMVRNGPRAIDIDLIDYAGLTLRSPYLILPHPRAHEREFVMRSLHELGVVLSFGG